MEENNVVSVLTMPVLLAGTALLFAIVIERVLEVIKSIYDYCDYFYKWSEQWNKRAEKVRDRLELRLDEAAKTGQADVDVVLIMASRFLGEPKANADSPYAVSANKVRALSMQTVFGVLGIAMGGLIANVVGLDAFQFVEYSLLSIEQQRNYQYLPTWWGMACTGAAMGLGASPMHNFIAAMEQAKRFRKLSNRLK